MSSIKRKIIRNVWILICIIQTFFFISSAVSQIGPGEDNPLRISVSNISINQSRIFRDSTGTFPHPVLSTISIIDYRARLIAGLADTAEWLGPNDTTEVGLPIVEIWRQVNEYHSENPSIPVDTDVYNQSPLPQFTEVRKNVPIPTNTMLIMDVSSSMVQELEDAKNGVRTYVELLRSVDLVGLIQFDRSIVRFDNLTADKQAIIDGINAAALGIGTAIYDPLMIAIQEMKSRQNRCGIIIYTDGQDNSSTTTPEAVIDSARVFGIPIFTIALGNDTREEELILIADQTGGIFFKAATAAEMSEVYTDLSNIMLNYYVMAHTTTDPQRNGTWRTVEVNVKYQDKEGIGKGEYFVPGMETPTYTDVAVRLTSVTDTTISQGGNEFNAVSTGDSFRYEISLNNLGANTANFISVHQTLPDSVLFLNASMPRSDANQDSLNWMINRLDSGEDSTITVFVQLDANYSGFPAELLSNVRIYAANDSAAQNNADADTVLVLQKAPLKNYDLKIAQTVQTDTTIEVENEIEPAVAAGDSFFYFLKITNLGPATAHDVIVKNIVADSISITKFSLTPKDSIHDALFWRLDPLMAQDSIQIEMTALLTDTLPKTPFPIVNIAEVIAESDTFIQNNLSTTTVYGIKKNEPQKNLTNLTASIQSQTDRFIIIDGDTVRAVFPGDEFEYQISMKNVGMYTAQDVHFTHYLPDSIQFRGSSVEPNQTYDTSLTWNFPSFVSNSEFSATISVELAGIVPRSLDQLISSVEVTAANDSLPADNVAIDTVYIVFPDTVLIDLQVTQAFISDTTTIIDGDTLPAVEEGDFYGYSVTVKNLGPVPARDFALRETVPDSVTLFEFSRDPDKHIADTLIWFFDSLAVNSEAVISFEVLAADSYEKLPHKLVHRSFVIAENDSVLENNSAQSEIYVIEKTGTGEDMTDVSVNLISVTPSTTVIAGKTVNAVRRGEQYKYELEITNEGILAATDVRLSHLLPHSVSFLDADNTPDISGDSLLWRFDQLLPGATSKINVNVQVPQSLPEDTLSLVSFAEISAVNDTIFSNNFDADTVFVISSSDKFVDLALSQSVIPHSLTVVEGDTVSAVFIGEPFLYALTVRNNGPGTTLKFSLADTISKLIATSNFNFQPASISDSLLLWQFDSLAAGNSLEISFDAIVAEAPFTPYPVPNPCFVIAANDSAMANNFASTLVYAIEPQQVFCDIAVSQRAITDSFAVANNDTVRFAKTGETYTYELAIRNRSLVTARSVTVSDRFPESVTVSNFSRAPSTTAQDSLVWFLGNLAPGARTILRFDTTVPESMPVGKNALINRVILSATNEDQAKLADNVSLGTVYNLVKPEASRDYTPIIQANPPISDVGGQISVRVQVLLPIETWDIWIYLADGTVITDFADDYIESILLTPNDWFDIDQKFTDVELYTPDKVERIKFELRTIDVFGELRTAQAFVLVESNNNFNLDRNVYTAGTVVPLAINFKLNSNRNARLDLYDLTGAKVTKIAEGPYQAGWNTYHWDGVTESGQIIGNGLYFITIESGDYRAMKKVMVVQ